MIERSGKMYRLIQANTTTFLNLHLTMKTEKHGISLLSRKISADRQLVPVHNTTHGNSGSSSLVPGQPHYLFETLPAMCRNTPGVPLFLQDERTERGGWQGMSSQKDALQQRLPTNVRCGSAFTHTKRRRTCSSSPQVRFCSRCGCCKCQQGFLMNLLSFALFPLCPKKQQSHLQEMSFFSGSEKGERPQGKITRN